MKRPSFAKVLALAALIAAPEARCDWAAKIRAAETASQKEPFAALDHLREALKEAEPFGPADLRLLETLVRLANACVETEDGCDDQETDRYVSRALEMRARVQGSDERRAELLMDLGSAARSREKHSEAMRCYQEALRLREQLFDPRDERTAQVHAAMAWVHQDQGDNVLARRAMQRALEMRETAGAAWTAGFAEILEDSADLYDQNKEEKLADRERDRVIAIREKMWRPSDPRFLDALRHLAMATRFRKAPAYAENLYRRVQSIQRRAQGASSIPYAKATAELAEFLQGEKRYLEAEPLFLEALAVRRQRGLRDLETAEWLADLAHTRAGLLRYHEAMEPLRQSLAIREKLLPASAYPVVTLRAYLIEVYAQAGDFPKAEAAFEPFRWQVRDYQYLLANTAETFADKYLEVERYSQAAEKLEIAVAARESYNANDPELPQTLTKLATTYHTMGRPEDAGRVNMRAAQILWAGVFRDPEQRQAFFIGLAVLAAAGLAFGGVAALLHWLLARRLDRQLAALYAPAPAPIPAEGPTTPEAPVEQTTAQDLPALDIANAPLASTDAGAEPAPPEVVQAAPPPPPLPPPVHAAAFHGHGGDLFAIRVLNLALSLVTAGIYSFWGKAKIRRYVCAQTEFQNDRFVFHGVGPELLRGWLKGLPFIALIILVPNLLPLFWQNPSALWVAQWVALGLFLVFWPLARAGAYRYRLNRMSWRGVRFSFRGSTWRFLSIHLFSYLWVALTLGLYTPFLQVRARRFLYNQTHFGDGVFQFTGHGRHLVTNYIFAVPASFLTLGLFWAWWSALRHRYFWAHTTFAGARFRCTATGGKLLRLWLGNLLLIIPTLGLAASWATTRTARFWTRNVQVVGDPDLAAIRQDERATSAVGESFADFLGFDFGF
jgi:uncharacterized membrane protein YjgN (DUF898 family)